LNKKLNIKFRHTTRFWNNLPSCTLKVKKVGVPKLFRGSRNPRS